MREQEARLIVKLYDWCRRLQILQAEMEKYPLEEGHLSAFLHKVQEADGELSYRIFVDVVEVIKTGIANRLEEVNLRIEEVSDDAPADAS